VYSSQGKGRPQKVCLVFFSRVLPLLIVPLTVTLQCTRSLLPTMLVTERGTPLPKVIALLMFLMVISLNLSVVESIHQSSQILTTVFALFVGLNSNNHRAYSRLLRPILVQYNTCWRRGRFSGNSSAPLVRCRSSSLYRALLSLFCSYALDDLYMSYVVLPFLPAITFVSFVVITFRDPYKLRSRVLC